MYQNKDPSKNLTYILYYEFDFTTLYEIGLKKLPKELHLHFFLLWKSVAILFENKYPRGLIGYHIYSSLKICRVMIILCSLARTPVHKNWKNSAKSYCINLPITQLYYYFQNWKKNLVYYFLFAVCKYWYCILLDW